MKKRILQISLALVLSICSITQITTFAKAQVNPATLDYSLFLSEYMSLYSTDSYDTETIKTPNGTDVQLLVFNEDFSEDEKDRIANNILSSFPNTTILAPASQLYNCHSYAWLYRMSSNTKWMNSPSAYYEDGSYYESTGKVGDIICYFDRYGNNLHSGVVVEVLGGTPNGVCGNANLVNVVSKWGSTCLVQHRGDICPYPDMGAVTIKYYTHDHRYSTTPLPYADNYHRYYCDYTACSNTKDETHTFTTLKPKPYCAKCRYNGHTIQPWSAEDIAA